MREPTPPACVERSGLRLPGTLGRHDWQVMSLFCGSRLSRRTVVQACLQQVPVDVVTVTQVVKCVRSQYKSGGGI
jgi:hypothetical protein